MEKKSRDHVLFKLAPREALIKLIDSKPEIHNEIARKYRFDYLRLLEEERARLLLVWRVRKAKARQSLRKKASK